MTLLSLADSPGRAGRLKRLPRPARKKTGWPVNLAWQDRQGRVRGVNAVKDKIIGRVLFTDGGTREVHENADGRQYVVDGGMPVFGVWVLVQGSNGPVVKAAK